MTEALIFLARIFLFALFLVAGLGKITDLKGERNHLEDLGISKTLSPTLAVLLPIVELTIAFCFLFNVTAYFAATTALALLLIFTAFLGYQLAKGNSADCYCFGSIHSEPVSPKSLIRNLLFAIPAVFLIFQGNNVQKLDFSKFSFELSLTVLRGIGMTALLGLVCLYMKRILENQVKILRQLEIISFGEIGVERKIEGVKHPEEGLPIGAPLPEFTTFSIDGEKVSSTKIFSAQNSALMVFVSPSCHPCNALMPELLNWQEKLKGKLDFVFISSGKPSENKEKFNLLSNKIFLQKDREISELFGVQWTPTAVFVNKHNKIASKPVLGNDAIKSLLEEINSAPQELDFITDENLDGKIGQKIPGFELPTASGKKVSLEEFLGKRTLLTYWSPNCGFCKEMLEDLKNWTKSRGADDPELVIISASNDSGKQIEADLQAPVLIDEERKVIQKLGMTGTPSAILIDEKGTIVSEVAVGARKIWALLGKQINSTANDG